MPKKIYYCHISGQRIPDKRVEALKFLGTPEKLWTCVEHSQVRKIKGIYSGENGTSELIFCDKVYNDSVRSVLRKSDAPEKEFDEPEPKSDLPIDSERL